MNSSQVGVIATHFKCVAYPRGSTLYRAHLHVKVVNFAGFFHDNLVPLAGVFAE